MPSKRTLSLSTLVCIAWCSGCIGTTPQNGKSSSPAGASSGTARTRAIGQAKAISACGLPEVGSGGIAKPQGTAGNLMVLDWAGFRAAVSWTYDDAQPSHIAHYEELQATGVRQTFYINTGRPEGKDFDATWTTAAKDGHELGNHTSSHCHADGKGCLFGSWPGSVDAEFDQCTAYVTQHYPQPAVWTSASPYGDTGFSESAKTRFLLNRGVGGGAIGPNDSTDPFNLPCYMAAAGATASTFNTEIAQARSAGKWQIMLIHTIKPTTANWYNPVAITDITESIADTEALGDVWQDSLVNVGAYWVAQKQFATLTPAAQGAQTIWTWQLPAHFPPGRCLRVTVDRGSLQQGGKALTWNSHGYYEVSLDVGALTVIR